MINKTFSNWARWDKRESLEGIKYPGIYCIAISKNNLSNKSFNWTSEIDYIGMTNSQEGLKGRLKQFNNKLFGKKAKHRGADRFRFKHQNYQELVDMLFVSVCSFKCNVKSYKPEDLRIMGDVAKFEYECFATYVEKFSKMPEFNNKKLSPKYSLKYR
jgi:hypothetical protein